MTRHRSVTVVLVLALVVLAGCSGLGGGPADTPQRGELTVTVQNNDDVPHGANVTLVSNGTETGGMSAVAIQPGDSARFAATETEGPVTVRVQVGDDSRSVEWSPAECVDLRVETVVGSEGRTDVTSRCAA